MHHLSTNAESISSPWMPLLNSPKHNKFKWICHTGQYPLHPCDPQHTECTTRAVLAPSAFLHFLSVALQEAFEVLTLLRVQQQTSYTLQWNEADDSPRGKETPILLLPGTELPAGRDTHQWDPLQLLLHPMPCHDSQPKGISTPSLLGHWHSSEIN